MLGLGLGLTSPAVLGGGPPLIPWLPTDLGVKLKAWWNADDHGTANMTDDGAGAISSWKDRIGVVNCSGITTARPTWATTSFNSAYAGVTFNGTSNTLVSVTFGSLPIGATAGDIVQLVSVSPANSAYFQTFGYGPESGNARVLRGYMQAGPIGQFAITEETTQLADTAGGPINYVNNHMCIGEWESTTERAWLDGSATIPASATIATLNTQSSGQCRIGSRQESATMFFNGVVRHIFVTTLLTTLERQQLEGWLAHNHALTSLLPGGHPYKSAPP